MFKNAYKINIVKYKINKVLNYNKIHLDDRGSVKMLAKLCLDIAVITVKLLYNIFFYNLHSGGWNQGSLDTAAT
jgi:hypothetical protein